jgi:hypothetical protein
MSTTIDHPLAYYNPKPELKDGTWDIVTETGVTQVSQEEISKLAAGIIQGASLLVTASLVTGAVGNDEKAVIDFAKYLAGQLGCAIEHATNQEGGSEWDGSVLTRLDWLRCSKEEVRYSRSTN